MRMQSQFIFLDLEHQGTMRFNKGSASLNKFDPLPKIEEQINDCNIVQDDTAKDSEQEETKEAEKTTEDAPAEN